MLAFQTLTLSSVIPPAPSHIKRFVNGKNTSAQLFPELFFSGEHDAPQLSLELENS